MLAPRHRHGLSSKIEANKIGKFSFSPGDMAREPEMHFSLLALGILAVILFGIQDCFPPYTAFTSTLVTGAGRPVRRIIGSRSSAREVTFHSFEFQSIYFGREGPNYMSIKGEPSKGAQQLAKAELFGQEEVTTAKFELTDEAGNVLELLHFVKLSHSSSDGEYFGLVSVPTQPFRVRVSGKDTHGADFKLMCNHVFRPVDQPPTPPLVPPGIPAETEEKLRKALEAEDQRTKAQNEEESRKHPDGLIIIPQVQVSNVTYETFLSAKGNALGIQMQYDARFSQDGLYSPSPFVFPVYENFDMRGSVEMKVINESIDPLPDVQYPLQRPDLLKYDTAAGYRANTVYHFTVDMIPDYVIQNAKKTKFCIYVQKFGGSPKRLSLWEALSTNGMPIKYRIDIRNTDFNGETDNFHAQKVFLASFVNEGSQDCGPNPNINF